MANSNRYSKEIELLCSKGHWTAEQVHKELKKTYRFIGIGSVYRNLNELVEHDVLMKTPGLTDKIIYEKLKSPHAHLFCHSSGTILDVDSSMIDFSKLSIPEGFAVDTIQIQIHGNFMTESSCKIAIESQKSL